jgi:predicted dehydrogenase
MDALRAAVVGVGYFGSRHANKLSQLPGVRLEYLVDIDLPRAEEAAGRLGAHATSDVRELAGRVDIATVAVPTREHAAVAEILLDAGIHLLIEKPLCATVDEADRLVGAATARGLKLCVGHLERFNPAFIAVHGRVILPRFIEAHRLAPFSPRGTDVDVVLDLMIHDLDIILSLVDSPTGEVRADGASVLTEGVDIANARIEFANGCTANVTASRISAKWMRKLRIFQPDCYLSIDFRDRTVDIARAGSSTVAGPIPGVVLERIEYPEGDALQTELAAFVDAVRGHGAFPVTGQDGRRALELALTIKHRLRGETR